MTLRSIARRRTTWALGAVAVGAAVLVPILARRNTAAPAVPTELVSRQDIVVTIDATGTVEPIDLVEVKSKASGQIVRMPVQIGSMVRAGQLLAQIDPRDVQSQYDQTLAALRAAQAKANISSAQKKRADDLFSEQVITAAEHESATLDFANAQAQLVAARTDLSLARQRRDDATVRAPTSGTILEQLVSTGQVISSATSSASGGTSLLKMADLSRIRMRALVSERDIGSVQAGQTAAVTVDAFPQRSFLGQVEKIEPQAVVQQSVTMFPVLISISNDQRLLLPGMNGEISMLIDRRDDVLAVPVEAVRTVRELPAIATALGMDPDSVRAQVQRQQEARAQERAARAGAGADSSRVRGAAMERGGTAADSAGARGRWRERMRSGGGQGSGRGEGRGALGGGRGAGRTRGDRGAGGGASGGMGAGASGAGSGNGAAESGATGGISPAAGGSWGSGRGGRAQVAFVRTVRGLEPRVVRLGLTNYDYAEILDGLKEGESVVLLNVAELQAKRQQDQSRMRERMGGGVPGAPGAGGGGRGPGGGR